MTANAKASKRTGRLRNAARIRDACGRRLLDKPARPVREAHILPLAIAAPRAKRTRTPTRLPGTPTSSLTRSAVTHAAHGVVLISSIRQFDALRMAACIDVPEGPRLVRGQ